MKKKKAEPHTFDTAAETLNRAAQKMAKRGAILTMIGGFITIGDMTSAIKVQHYDVAGNPVAPPLVPPKGKTRN